MIYKIYIFQCEEFLQICRKFAKISVAKINVARINVALINAFMVFKLIIEVRHYLKKDILLINQPDQTKQFYFLTTSASSFF